MDDLKRKYLEHLERVRLGTFTLADKLVDAVSRHTGWEEGAVKLVQEAIIPALVFAPQRIKDLEAKANWIQSELLPWLELHKTTMSPVGKTVIEFIETNKEKWK
jgi:hypothetical protein